jgi:hypothetical protein
MIFTFENGFQYVTDKGNVSIYADWAEKKVSVTETPEKAIKFPDSGSTNSGDC